MKFETTCQHYQNLLSTNNYPSHVQAILTDCLVRLSAENVSASFVDAVRTMVEQGTFGNAATIRQLLEELDYEHDSNDPNRKFPRDS